MTTEGDPSDGIRDCLEKRKEWLGGFVIGGDDEGLKGWKEVGWNAWKMESFHDV